MTPKIDLALWCFTALMNLLPDGASPSYREKYSEMMGRRVGTCVSIAHRAEEEGLDPLIAIAVGAYESKFDKRAKSSKGAVGIMQMTPIALKTWCSAYSIKTGRPSVLPSQLATRREIRRCDHIGASIRYLKHVDAQDPDLCSALARYNAGPKGSCRGRGGVYGRAVVRLMSEAHDKVLDHYRLLDVIQAHYDPDEEREESCGD
jgi:hypothetical protein